MPGLLIVGNSNTSTDQGCKLVERGINDLIKAGLIHLMITPKESLNGPGDHEYLAADREKEGSAVNHYDLSPLLPFIHE